jgi:hypothetical protein
MVGGHVAARAVDKLSGAPQRPEARPWFVGSISCCFSHYSDTKLDNTHFLEKTLFKVDSVAHFAEYLHASPLHHAKTKPSSGVPFLIVHGTKDIVVPIADSL